MRHRSLSTERCSIARTLDLVGEWWSLLIIRDAFYGLRRFGDFQKSLGVARNILTARLKKLVAAKILEQAVPADGGKHMEYTLTERGRDLFVTVIALRQWGDRWMHTAASRPSMLVDAKVGQPLVRLDVRAADGRVLAPEDVRSVVNPGRKSRS